MRYSSQDLSGGVGFCEKRNKFRAKLWVRTTSYPLGFYQTSDEAQLAYDTAKSLLFRTDPPTSNKLSSERIAQIREWLRRKLATLIPQE